MPRSRIRKILSFAAISLAGLVVGVVLSFYIVLKLSVPPTSGEIRSDYLQYPVEITFDSMGICQIWAEIETDAFFALGYQHAADRLFQMDVSRRLAGGRLSEMLGSITRDVDTEQRRIGHHRLAERAALTLSDENRQRLQAYCDGINAYVRDCRALPFEYRFLPVSFEDWTVRDCLTLLSFQTWFSNALMSRDEFYMELAETVGYEKAQTLVIPYPDWAPATVEAAVEYGAVVPAERPAIERKPGAVTLILDPLNDSGGANSVYQPFQRALAVNLFDRAGLPMHMTHSSNAWVVAPEKSSSGKPILASDPHLELTRLPQFWYAAGMHVKRDSIDVLGISTPGLPFFIMGHNGRAAWAFTAGGVDVIDYFVEKLNPGDPNEYLAAGQWREFDIIHDSLFVADLDSFVYIDFRHTVNGPVLDRHNDNGELYSFNWVGFENDLNEAVSNGFELHRVGTFEQFRQTVTGLGALDANMLYANADGNIGYQLTTPLPVRPVSGDTSFTLGYNASAGWTGYCPLEITPHTLNPPEGWIASCNNLPRRSPPVQGHFFADRILAITHLLNGMDELSADDMRRFQMDRHDRYLLRFRDEVVRLLESLDEIDLAAKMRDWNGSMETESNQAALVEVFLSELKRLTFEDELESLYHQVPDKWIERLDQVNDAQWFDDIGTSDVIETYDEIAINAMEEAIGAADTVAWGDMHTLTMRHPLAMIPILGALLNLERGPLRWGGSAGTLFASFNREAGEGRYESVAGPSWRFVIDFADIDAATMVLPAGNSGNPMSEHFFDFNQMWQNGRQWVVPFHYEKVKERAVSTLVLLPEESP